MTSQTATQPSVFNCELTTEKGFLLFNSVSAVLLRLNQRQYDAVTHLLAQLRRAERPTSGGLHDLLMEHGFVVPSEEDEYEREHQKFLARKRSTEHALFVIAPTMRCNLKCAYCFQKDLDRTSNMSEQTQDAVVRFFSKCVEGSRRAGVQWFGGEPLMALRIIEKLTKRFQEICETNDIKYNADMITSGILLSSSVISRLAALSLEALQITLDGSPQTFASRKGIGVKRAETHYADLLERIPAILDSVASLVVRINVDRENIEEAKDVVRWFKSHGLMDPRIDFRLGFLRDFKGLIGCTPSSCYTPVEFRRIDVEFRQFLADEGFSLYGFPTPLSYPCIASLEHAFTIDSCGRIGMCVPETGNPAFSYANVNNTQCAESFKSGVRYREFDPFVSAYCRGCELLPVCLGQCPRQQASESHFECAMKQELATKLQVYSDYHRATSTVTG